ncbi:aldo/keto reductase [Sinomonas sp. JGH33]|uniref:Aldo/keto reductase n=1 Tax=Sinomonas terricola TaxID=3110330 RepID=A0ABU5T8D6_9MICC|nr:aldo/keto reductase [Sinomonas sp. JGH33]MEA5455934.1 aldo/keto reductase [Sinomonas sp. JGH33]
MDYRTVGSTGVRVSPLCFGTMSFGAEADEETSAAMYRRVRERGINFFDSANVYGGGASEEILGRLIARERDDVVITSKVFYPTSADVNAQGLSRRHIMQAVEASLARLGTDRIDFYFVHAFDPATPIEQTLRALDDLQRDGKILYPAVSNWAAWQIATALGVSAREGLARFELIEPMYSLVKRQAEVEILPLAQAANLGVITYSPLGGGLLTGKYRSGQRPEGGRLTENARYADRYGLESDRTTAERFVAFSDDAGISPAALAVAWAMGHPGVTAPIIGARNLEQLEGSLAALDVEMTPELRAEVSALSPTPAPATDRTEVLTGKWT